MTTKNCTTPASDINAQILSIAYKIESLGKILNDMVITQRPKADALKLEPGWGDAVNLTAMLVDLSLEQQRLIDNPSVAKSGLTQNDEAPASLDDWQLKRLYEIHLSVMESSFSIKNLAEELIDAGNEDCPSIDRLDVVAKLTAMKKLGEIQTEEACTATNIIDKTGIFAEVEA